MPECPLCGRLQDEETSFQKYLAPGMDRPLPKAAGSLSIIAPLGVQDAETHHFRRCPRCRALFEYRASHEYLVNGTEDEETLTRLTPAQTATVLRQQAWRLEEMRREIDDIESAAGRLGDYIDRGRPSDTESRDAYERMMAYGDEARQLQQRLQTGVESLRLTCPEILEEWAAAHLRVTRSFLESLPSTGDFAQTARFVAEETRKGWEQLPGPGNAYLSINTYWLEGYLERLDTELNPSGEG